MGIREMIFGHFDKKDDTYSSVIEKEVARLLKENPNLKKEELQEQLLMIKHKQEQANNPNFDPNRRNAMKNIGIGALLLTTAPNQIIDIVNKVYENEVLHKQEAQAYWGQKLDERRLPPGIRSCRDEAIKWAFQSYRDINYDKKYKNDFFSRLNYKNYRYVNPQIRDDTPFIEPAYWFLVEGANYYENEPKEYVSKLKKKNPALDYFRLGINGYFGRWVKNGRNDTRLITDNFTTSIIVAANRPESDLKKYNNMNISEKTQYLNGLMNIFNNMKVNPKARKINDNYDKRLIAQWSAVFLSDNYTYIKDKTQDELIYKHIERALRKRDHKIRGPPKLMYQL